MYCPNCRREQEFIDFVAVDETTIKVCTSCDAALTEKLELTREECKLLELEFSTHWINRDRYQETIPLIKRIFRFAETGKVDDD